MKMILGMLFLSASIIFLSCGKSSTESDDEKYTISIEGYGSTIETSYYKLWSDNSWERFNQAVNIDGVTYATILTSDGYEYYYSSEGYAGIQPYGESLILFDTPMASLPDKIIFGNKYTFETTFSSAGIKFTMKFEEVLQDTVPLTVPCGTFQTCLWFKATSTISSGNQSSVSKVQSWLAKGPSEIQTTLNSGTTLKMASGFVNGQSWGSSSSGLQQKISKKQNTFSMEKIIRPLLMFHR